MEASKASLSIIIIVVVDALRVGTLPSFGFVE
jgi:hypothetical protein